ncbi:MAG: hypothetical protein IPN97_08335, partial [Saprospiraceae bacterium]|nr:hypothetical protein [Saprospiraceae bacterium]
ALNNGTISKTSGVVTVNYVNMQNVTAIGGATFNASNSTNLGNNNGWNFLPISSQNLYWIGNGGNWTDASHWSLSSGGPASGCIPSPYDNVFFDVNSFTSGGQTITINQTAYCKSMNWNGVSNSPTLAGNNSLNIHGSP